MSNKSEVFDLLDKIRPFKEKEIKDGNWSLTILLSQFLMEQASQDVIDKVVISLQDYLDNCESEVEDSKIIQLSDYQV